MCLNSNILHQSLFLKRNLKHFYEIRYQICFDTHLLSSELSHITNVWKYLYTHDLSFESINSTKLQSKNILRYNFLI